MDTLGDEFAIGLDLGTTFSCIGVYRNGAVEIIPNKRDEKTTPSIVVIDCNLDILVGEDTEDNLVKNYDSCIYEIKRLIGRKFSEKEVQKEIEKLPFKIIKSKDDETPMVEIMNNGIPITYNPVEISSFIIKKMVQSAEKFLNKKIKKLVITVPAYFNDSQRKLTKQAAELVGLNVLRIINEPTAAALSYGFDKNQDLNEKILIFDLGGGTFDVSILSIKKDENNPDYKTFQVLGTSGDTQLGGEDFDNKLVDFCLNKMNNKEKIKMDKKCIKKLKINCEKIKKTLSFENEATLRINNFYENEDISIKIKKEEFEDICNDLFKRLETSLDDALINAKMTKNEINEIILVGGSTRIPKIKKILNNYFPNCKINDSINPDEAVAIGATLEAEKILHNQNKSISNFLLKDITPLSLGTNIVNQSKDPKIKSEGEVMSVIIKRGTPIPYSGSEVYSTNADDQTGMVIDIYEGENIFVKYNHLLKKSQISGLKKRPKGKTQVIVTFDIDINGILIVNAKEKSENNDGKSMTPVIIKNDDISLSKEQMEKLREKNKKLLEKLRDNDLIPKIDYTNLKKSLKDYKDAYIKSEKEYNEKHKEDNDDDDVEEDEIDERIIFKNNYNNTLEEFIDSFEKKEQTEQNFDNETAIEKYFLYIRELFLSYIETLKLKSLEVEDRKHIIKKIKEYINKYINKNSDYLNNLIQTLYIGLIKGTKPKENKIRVYFYGIVIYTMEKLNDFGNEYIQSGKKYCKYYSLLNYEQAYEYYEKYLSEVKKEILPKKDMQNLEKQKNITIEKIKDITTGAIVLCYESFKGGYLFGEEIKSKSTGVTNQFRLFAIGDMVKNMDIKDVVKRLEMYKIVLNNYEKILLEIQNSEEFKENTKKEAICIANIIKLNQILGELDNKSRTLLRYAERCKYIVDVNKDREQFKKEKWFIEFNNLYNKLKEKEPKYEEYHRIFPEIRKQNSKIFDDIEEKFNKKKSNIDFIEFILNNHPYNGYEEDLKNEKINFKNFSLELVNILLEKYHPDNYTYQGDEQTKLKYCIIHEITKNLNKLYTTPQ